MGVDRVAVLEATLAVLERTLAGCEASAKAGLAREIRICSAELARLESEVVSSGSVVDELAGRRGRKSGSRAVPKGQRAKRLTKGG